MSDVPPAVMPNEVPDDDSSEMPQGDLSDLPQAMPSEDQGAFADVPDGVAAPGGDAPI